MVTVVIQIELQIPGISSLKEKRRVLKSLIASIQNKFNVSIAEVGDNDVYRKATLGVALVSNSSSFGHQAAQKVINQIERNHDLFIADYRMETY